MSDKMGDKTSDKMSDKEKLFYESLKNLFHEEEFVITEMASELMGIPKSTVRRHLNKLRKINRIRSDGKNRGTRYYLDKE